MWPWGHLAVGYLLYTGLFRSRYGKSPTAHTTAAVMGGTQLPDVVDKPLAWSVQLLPNGRSLTHSAVIGIVLIGCLLFVASRRGHYDLSVAFSVGYVSHIASDALYPAIGGNLSELGFLLWPIVPPVEYSTQQSFIAHFEQLDFGPMFWFEVGLVALAGIVWTLDGVPGLPRRCWWRDE